MTPTGDQLLALARKYREMARLRERKDGGDHDQAGDDGSDGERATRATLRRLAGEFPGCLRELDTLGLTEIQRRAVAAEGAAGGQPLEPWMAWIHGYHALMRATLALKPRLARGASTAAPGLESLAAEASDLAGFPLDAEFVRAVARPPGGRIGVVVLRRLATLFQAPARTISEALFPVRRPSPYQLD